MYVHELKGDQMVREALMGCYRRRVCRGNSNMLFTNAYRVSLSPLFLPLPAPPIPLFHPLPTPPTPLFYPQRQPLIPLHPEPDPENSEHMILTCSALPQKSTEEHSLSMYWQHHHSGLPCVCST